MLLILITNGSADNPKLWSGTPYRLKQLFSEQSSSTIPCLNYALPRIWRSLCARIFNRYEFVNGGSQDPWYAPWMERRLAKKIKHSVPQSDWYLFVCCANVPAKKFGQEKYAIYTDNLACCYAPYLSGNPWWRSRYERYLFRKEEESIQRSDCIFTQNEWTRKYMLEKMGLPASRVHNVGFGVNLKPYMGEKNYDNEEMLIVLRHGTEHYKGLDLLLEAFKILRQRRPTAKLNVVGTTGEAVDGVTYWDGYPREKTVELFQQAALYVMPALREPNGITYLEGLANRAPIVGLNRFAVPEFSGYGKWGFLCEHEDPQELSEVLDGALSDKGRLAEMGQLGQHFVAERYDWTKVVRKMIDIMEANK